MRQIQQQRRMSQEHPLAVEQQPPRQFAPPPEPQISAPAPPSETVCIQSISNLRIRLTLHASTQGSP